MCIFAYVCVRVIFVCVTVIATLICLYDPDPVTENSGSCSQSANTLDDLKTDT